MKLVWFLFALHLAALVFGVLGLLIALPHPELWAGSPLAGQVFAFGMQHGGALHILFGAATMLTFGVVALGWRQSLGFFLAATLLPLGAELLGTGTGWPFGAYAYTDGLGFKVAGRVPVAVPLSWFYMGFAAYLLAVAVAGRRGGRGWVPVILGAWLLTAWDLVLDPAMASPSLPIRFWIWHQSGPYFGMPVRNLVGWSVTGLLFIALGRLLWRGDPAFGRSLVQLPLAMYAANVAFAMALSLGVGLWLPCVAAAVLGLAPAALALRPPSLVAGALPLERRDVGSAAPLSEPPAAS